MLLAEDRAQPKQIQPKLNHLLVKFCECGVYQAFHLRFENVKLQLALRLPMLEILFRSIRRLGQEVAVSDRLDIESGEDVSTSVPMSLARRLRAYRDELPRLTVFH